MDDLVWTYAYLIVSIQQLDPNQIFNTILWHHHLLMACGLIRADQLNLLMLRFKGLVSSLTKIKIKFDVHMHNDIMLAVK